MCTGALAPDALRSGWEFEDAPSYSAKVKNEWSYTCAPPYAFTPSLGTALPLPSGGHLAMPGSSTEVQSVRLELW
jgi:hypothetical protein